MIINIISPHASVYLGGMEIVTLQMAKHLSKLGVTVRFFTRKTRTPTDVYRQLLAERNDQLEMIEVPVPSRTPLPNGEWPTFYTISRDFGIAVKPFYEQFIDADLFVTHLSVDSLYLPEAARTALHLHGSPDTTDASMEAAVKIPMATIAHSSSIKDWWAGHFPALSPSIFRNGIDTDFYSGNTYSERPIDILYVGRFMKHKGIDDILRSVRPHQNVVIAGNGLFLPELEELARMHHLEDRVTFYDTPSTETVRQLYLKAKIFACPSRGKEGLLTTLLEAAASGCAIVTTSGSGMTDLITTSHNGLVVEPGDIKALKQAFDTLLTNPSMRLSLANAVQDEVRRHWSWNAKSIELKGIYDAII